MKDHNPAHLKEAWVFCFLLGVVMINYPILHIFNKSTTLFGIPTLILYFYIGWPASILVIYLFVRNFAGNSHNTPTTIDQDGEEE